MDKARLPYREIRGEKLEITDVHTKPWNERVVLQGMGRANAIVWFDKDG